MKASRNFALLYNHLHFWESLKSSWYLNLYGPLAMPSPFKLKVCQIYCLVYILIAVCSVIVKMIRHV